MAALIKARADLNALDRQRYDALTIAAVAGNLKIVSLLLKAGAKSGQTTSPYDGTALIATAHLGHVDITKALIAAGAPLDHVNNLGWTALIEAIVLGDGGPRHTAIVAALVKAGANPEHRRPPGRAAPDAGPPARLHQDCHDPRKRPCKALGSGPSLLLSRDHSKS